MSYWMFWIILLPGLLFLAINESGEENRKMSANKSVNIWGVIATVISLVAVIVAATVWIQRGFTELSVKINQLNQNMVVVRSEIATIKQDSSLKTQRLIEELDRNYLIVSQIEISTPTIMKKECKIDRPSTKKAERKVERK